MKRPTLAGNGACRASTRRLGIHVAGCLRVVGALQRQTRVALVIAVGLLFAGGLCADERVKIRVRHPAALAIGPYDLNVQADLERMRADAQRLVRLSEQQEVEREWRHRARVWAGVLESMKAVELRNHFTVPEDHITKRERRGLKAIRREAATLLESSDAGERSASITAVREVIAAIENGRRPPAPRRIDTFHAPFVLIRHLSSPVARGRHLASNLEPDTPETAVDSSLRDPLPGTFWRRPTGIESLDLYHAFGREELPDIEGRAFEYAGPKTSYGGNPGFDVVCGDLRVKVKFGEARCEPFTARIFWALGYHVDPTDHARGLRIRYDRRMFREFHLRREILTTFSLFWVIPVHTINLQQRRDPFQYFTAAVLTDGSRISRQELKQRLFFDPNRSHPEDDPGNFRPEFESQIDYLLTVPANLQYRDRAVDSIGPWDFGQLGHEHRRELRGAGLLAAWLNWFDSRFENTRLKTVEQDDAKELFHFFGDLGGSLGRGKGFYSGRGELPDEFDWTFTRPVGFPRLRERTVPFRITGFKPIETTPAFREMTLDDARWMARLIARLSEPQLVQALIAAGFDSAHVRLYTEKLISRRDRMIKDLDLADIIPLLRPDGVDRELTYVPTVDGKVRVSLPDGRVVEARSSDAVVAGGRVVRVSTPPVLETAAGKWLSRP